MKIKADIHIHTAYSDGNGTIDEILIAARRAGLNAIAITDHNTSKAYRIAKMKSRNLLIIPGFEAETDAGHVLVLGILKKGSERVRYRYEELIEKVEELGGITILAHPAIYPQKIKRWIKCKPIAIEVINALYPLPKFQVNISMKIANKLSLPMTAGSDAHQPNQIGKAYMKIEVDKINLEEILEAIRKGKTIVNGNYAPLSYRIKAAIKYITPKIKRKHKPKLERIP